MFDGDNKFITLILIIEHALWQSAMKKKTCIAKYGFVDSSQKLLK